jgi:hypothetical protein
MTKSDTELIEIMHRVLEILEPFSPAARSRIMRVSAALLAVARSILALREESNGANAKVDVRD